MAIHGGDTEVWQRKVSRQLPRQWAPKQPLALATRRLIAATTADKLTVLQVHVEPCSVLLLPSIALPSLEVGEHVSPT